jgi:phosphate transport system ATP-binding protein
MSQSRPDRPTPAESHDQGDGTGHADGHIPDRPTPARAPLALAVTGAPRDPAAAAGLDLPPRLEIQGLSAWFDNHKAIADITMPIAAHQVTALIGPSGSGKSTLLRCLNQMHLTIPGARVGGRVLLDGHDIYEQNVDPVAVRRRIGMVFQRPNPFPTMSIYDNVAAGLRLTTRRLPKSHLDETVERSLTNAALWGEVRNRLGEPGASLSGGQQQRLCIARAIAVEPEVLLMDEPCSALDPASTLRIEDLIRELKHTYTVVIVTHNLQQAGRVSDQTAFMTIRTEGEPGQLVEHGPTDKLFTAPADKATEDYITGRFG